METVFVAHTTEAWEFSEPEFFQVSGTGGTVASTGFTKVREIMDERYNPGRCNIYLFYASDGDNSMGDNVLARDTLRSISQDACYTGYVEVSSGLSRQLATETGRLYAELASSGMAAASLICTTSTPTVSMAGLLRSTEMLGCVIAVALGVVAIVGVDLQLQRMHRALAR